MVANVHGPQFSGGANIAIKCPAHTYEQTVAFYRDTLALPLIEEEADGCIFQFGPNRLWVDLVPNLSQPDVWLEVETNDTEAAASFLKVNGVPRRDEVEQLREDFDGFFVSAPNGIVHLVIGHEEANPNGKTRALRKGGCSVRYAQKSVRPEQSGRGGAPVRWPVPIISARA